MNFLKHIEEMLLDRGYTIKSSLEEIDTEADFVIKCKNNNEMYGLYYIANPKIGINTLKFYCDEFDNYEKIIIVYEKVLTSFAKSFIQELEIPVEIFQKSFFSFNVTKHHLVPEHKLLNESEISTILSYHRITKLQLPRILESDPVVRYYGAKKGNVFKILRKDTYNSIYYRLVT